ncbi:MAG: mechanosensitive ion channel family protein [Actinomycetota bacterium]
MRAQDLDPRIVLTASGLLLGSVLLGFLGRHLLVRRLTNLRSVESVGTQDVILDGLSKVIFSLSIIGGLYGVSVAIPLSSILRSVAKEILLAAALLSVSIAAARTTGKLVGRYSSRHEKLPGATSIFANIARFFVLALGLLVMLQTLGVSVAPILTALGVGGLAVALALQDTLSSLFAGLHIIASKKLLPGDYVLLDSGEEGYVQDVNWRNTSLRTLRNNMIVVPNARLASAILTNYYQPSSEMALVIPVGVSYSSDLKKVEEVTDQVSREVLKGVEGGVEDFDPFVRYHTFGEFSVDFSVILRIKEPAHQHLIKHEFVKRLHRRYQEAGIEIPFPVRTVISQDGPDFEDRHLVRSGAVD